MLQKIWEALKSLSLSDKWLMGVSFVILINPMIACIMAALTLTYFLWKIGKQVVKD